MAKTSIVNNFLVGDIMEMCYNPREEKPEWFRFWNYPLRDSADIKEAREIIATKGACLGWGSAALVHANQGHEFRTVTP